MAGLARVTLLLPEAHRRQALRPGRRGQVRQMHRPQVLAPGRMGQPLRLLHRPAMPRQMMGRQRLSPLLLVTAAQAGLAACGAVGLSP